MIDAWEWVKRNLGWTYFALFLGLAFYEFFDGGPRWLTAVDVVCAVFFLWLYQRGPWSRRPAPKPVTLSKPSVSPHRLGEDPTCGICNIAKENKWPKLDD